MCADAFWDNHWGQKLRLLSSRIRIPVNFMHGSCFVITSSLECMGLVPSITSFISDYSLLSVVFLRWKMNNDRRKQKNLFVVFPMMSLLLNMIHSKASWNKKKHVNMFLRKTTCGNCYGSTPLLTYPAGHEFVSFSHVQRLQKMPPPLSDR